MTSNSSSLYAISELSSFQDVGLLRTGFIAALLGCLSGDIRICYYAGRLAGQDIHWRLRDSFDPLRDSHCPGLSAAYEGGAPLLEDSERLADLVWRTEVDPMTVQLYADNQLSLVVRQGALLSVVLIDAPSVRDSIDTIKAITKVYINLNRLLERGSIDSLTGLLNRRTFEEKLNPLFSSQYQLRRHNENGQLDYLAILDIDFFKQVNDGFGHLYGDEVLLLMGRMMREAFREQDWLFRIGGEEFVVVARGVSGDPWPIFDRFRVMVEQRDFPQVGRVTVSLGYTVIDHRCSLPDIQGRADEALYYAKEHGRNQLACYEALLEQGLLSGPAKQGDVDLF